jgi:hypothetical protein
MIPIVLTGTIVSNSIQVKHLDWKVRRQEYLEAIRYYKTFSKVYFCENSDYDLLHDPDFCSDKKFQPIKFKKSAGFEKGKGYQEFQMLDDFVSNSLCEKEFIKITGRYICENFEEIFRLIVKERNKFDFLIDTIPRDRIAITALFYVKCSMYLDNVAGSFNQMDDSKGIWAEHVIYQTLRNIESYSFLPRVPLIRGISGSTGKQFPQNTNKFKISVKNASRRISRILGIKHLKL